MMFRRSALAASVFAAAVTATVAFSQTPPERSRYLAAERAVYEARAAEKRGDVLNASLAYTTAISLVEATAPRELNLSKLVLAGEPLPSIGRRMVQFEIRLLDEMLAQSRPLIDPKSILRDLQGAYGKMAWLEPNNPTWPYLEAVALAVNQDYRAAFQKCREAAQLAGGEESVRQKARTLATHIKPAALAQEQMKEEDQRAYMEYVQSGAQALDFAMVSAQTSATTARSSGDAARAAMWERRYQDLKRQRDALDR